jgi:hypothetical membrane protein
LGVSSLAVIFNSGLIVGGICFATFMLGLGSVRGGVGGATYAGLGAIAGLAGALVGVFPMNQLATHSLVAFTFFNVSWIAIALASVDFLVRPDPRFPTSRAVVGFAAVAAFVGFIWAYAVNTSGGGSGLEPSGVRPTVDVVTVFEWAAIVGVVAWTSAVALGWERARDASVA